MATKLQLENRRTLVDALTRWPKKLGEWDWMCNCGLHVAAQCGIVHQRASEKRPSTIDLSEALGISYVDAQRLFIFGHYGRSRLSVLRGLKAIIKEAGR